MGRMCRGIFDGLVDWFSEPLHRPSEAQVGLCGSWQKMARVRYRSAAACRSLALGDININIVARDSYTVDKTMTELSNVWCMSQLEIGVHADPEAELPKVS